MTPEQQAELTKYSSNFDKFTKAFIKALDDHMVTLENSVTCNDQERQMNEAFIKGYRDSRDCNIEKIEQSKKEVMDYYKELINKANQV